MPGWPRGATQDDIERRLATQGDDLADRLQRDLATRPVHVRLLRTDASIEATQELVEDALAEALDRPIKPS